MAPEKNISPALGLVLIAIAIFLTLSFISYHPSDAGRAGEPGIIHNYGGKVGAEISLYLFLAVGWGAYCIPLLLLGEGVSRLAPHREMPRPFWVKILYEIAIVLSMSPLFAIQTVFKPDLLGNQLENVGLGGYWGYEAGHWLLKYLGLVGTRLVLVTVLVVASCLLTEMKPLIFIINQGRHLFRFLLSLLPSRQRVKVTPASPPRPAGQLASPAEISLRRGRGDEKNRRELERKMQEIEREKEKLERERESLKREQEEKRELKRQERKKLKALKKEEKRRREKRPAPASPARPAIRPAPVVPPSPVGAVAGSIPGPYQLPSSELLETPPPLSEREVEDNIEVNSRILESTLLDFGAEAKVVGAERGPTVTRYELQPAPGIKVGKIKALDNDIALAMKATSIRILTPIPGKAALGIEVPNSTTALVYMKEMIESPEYQAGSHILPLAIGKDISGHSIVADLTEMPHLLIAGATGSGKTVCMNSIIISLLFSRTPEEMKLILVDPKKVEMSAFARLPHLLCPVVTDVTKTSLALAWLVKEMEDRYDLFSRVGARNIEGYNNKKEKLPRRENGEEMEEFPPTIPYIVLMIDELADLMLAASFEIENAITRLAHLSRAVGIHMILATQRPSVDVITGVIKANFPARISFQVAAKVDSRTVLDASGADKLLGNGDLLFLPPGTSRMVRAQGTLCHDSEIEAVIGFINRQREPRFEQEIFQKGAKAKVDLGGGEDILLEAAIEVIKQTEQASVSVLQRKLKIGYSRAARIMDILEEQGIVGSYQGTKAREILIDTYAGEKGEEETGEEREEGR